MKLKKKLGIHFLLVALVPLLLMTLLMYANTSELLIASQQNSLEIIADLKSQAIDEYFTGFRKKMNTAKNHSVVRTNLPIINHWQGTTNRPEYLMAKELLRDQLSSMVENFDLNDVILTDTGGSILFAIKPEREKQPIEKVLLIGAEAFTNGQKQLFVSDLYLDTKNSYPNFLVSAPIYGLDNVLIGTMVFEINAKKLFDLIQDPIGLGKTGETIIARRVADGRKMIPDYPYAENGNYVLYLNSLRSDPNAAFKYTIQIGAPNGHPAQEAVLGTNGAGLDVDYQGHKVMAIWRYLPAYHWGMVVKIDQSEFLLPVNQLAGAIFVFGIVAGLIVLLISWLLGRTISSPIEELTKIAKKIGEGDLKVKFDERKGSASDEIGVLTKTLADSVFHLKDLYENLEQRVEERTEKLKKSETELEKALLESERANKLMVGRELKMVELKKKILSFHGENKKNHEN
ncbi:MAG: HAMP domain-containing protein [Candidatus Magasanikbacteria bacterium]|nr:HAMP domain-containing protein [Candidatus Magasanikbacteria bacterium]